MVQGRIDASSAIFSEMTVPQLKEELRQRGLKVSGVKAELLERLMVDGNDADSDIRPLAAEAQSFIPPPSKLDYIPDEKPDTQSPIEGCVDSSSAVFSAMSVPQLKEELRQRGLKVSGVKAELLGRLMVDGNGADSDIRPLAPDMVDRNDAESESDIRPPVKEARSFIPPSKLFFVPDEESDNKALPADVAEAIISDIAVELNFERWRVAGAVRGRSCSRVAGLVQVAARS